MGSAAPETIDSRSLSMCIDTLIHLERSVKAGRLYGNLVLW
jgi:hypothetical protein